MRGVYIPRRDTDSFVNTWAGGRIFPGLHHHARFDVVERNEHYSVTMNSDDGAATVHVSGRVIANLVNGSIFGSLEAASEFFAQGSLGYSVTDIKGKYDGIELCCTNWRVDSLEIDAIRSSYFEDPSLFPRGSIEFDCALLMREIAHEWHGRPDLCCAAEVEA